MGATRDIALNELPIRGISINAESANTTTINVVASDSGIIFVNKETSGVVTYVLPAVADGAGKMWWFYNGQTAYNIVVKAPSNIFIGANTTSSTNMTTSGNLTGDSAIVFGDGTYYYLIEFVGTWAGS